MGAAFSSKAPLVEDTDTKRDISFAQSTDARRSVGGGAEFRYKFWFSSQTYYMMRPIENVHIYLWILKDLSWSQDWYYPALIFGALALLWCGALMYEAYRWRSLYEGYMIIGVTMWLTANYVWMAGTTVSVTVNQSALSHIDKFLNTATLVVCRRGYARRRRCRSATICDSNGGRTQKVCVSAQFYPSLCRRILACYRPP